MTNFDARAGGPARLNPLVGEARLAEALATELLCAEEPAHPQGGQAPAPARADQRDRGEPSAPRTQEASPGAPTFDSSAGGAAGAEACAATAVAHSTAGATAGARPQAPGSLSSRSNAPTAYVSRELLAVNARADTPESVIALPGAGETLGANDAASGEGFDADADALPALRTPDEPTTSFESERPDLLRDLRRIWMSASARRTPITVMTVSLRLARVPLSEGPEAAAGIRRTREALREALSDVGTVYALAPYAFAVVVSNRLVPQVCRIAEAVRATIDERAATNVRAPMIFAAGVSALHRDDDPTAVVCLAEHCLMVAEAEPRSRVVSEADREARMRHQRR